jgi:nitroreductase
LFQKKEYNICEINTGGIMKKILTFTLALFISFAAGSTGLAKEKSVKNAAKKEIILEKIDFTKGKTVLQALKDRHSSRDFSGRQLDITALSELLWAAGGINREPSGGKTAPTAMNGQETDIYAFLPDGVYLYMPKEHKLVLAVNGDNRAASGLQDYAAGAAVNLVYVSDLAKMKGGDDNQNMLMAAVDVGHVSENVYLYCSSAGLACVVRAYVDAPSISKLLNLKNSQKVILAQSVGYKK